MKGETGWSSRGTTQLGVRWNTVTCFATFAISGRIWTAVQPIAW